MLLELKPEITYGPVRSRRLGRSLGINLLPSRSKVCSFDCVYCQYGWTRCFDIGAFSASLPRVDEVMDAVTRALHALDTPPAYLTFSGNGEPTLHPQLPAIIDELLRLRDRLAPQARTAILSNASTAGDARVCEALSRLDARIMKLDAGDEQTFRSFNRPAASIHLEQVLEGLSRLPGLTLQSLIASGTGGNDDPAHLERWLQRVVALSPENIQVYTLARPTAASGLLPADPDLLATLAEHLRRHGVAAEVFGSKTPPEARHQQPATLAEAG